MADRELLELAAKAYGAVDTHAWSDKFAIMMPGKEDFALWNPLDDDGDAFRLMVALGISPEVYRELSVVEACTKVEFFYEKFGEDMSAAATRRSMVQAAAAMGEQL